MAIKSSKMSRLGALVLFIVLIIGALLVPAQAVTVDDFADVPADAWYYDSVSHVVEEGLFYGTSDTTFDPMANMTRGMFITVLGRYARVDPDVWCRGKITGSLVNLRSGPGTSYTAITALKNGTTVTLLGREDGWYKVRYNGQTGYISGDLLSPVYHSFADVAYEAYYAGYVVWGYENGIVNGRDEQNYSPEDYITREEICCLLNRYIDYAGISMTENGRVEFTDGDAISSWAAEDIAAMQSYGIVKGEPDGDGYMFRPGSNATRAEVATMFQRLSAFAPAPTPTPAPTATPVPTKVPQPEGTPDISATPSPDDIDDTPAAILDAPISVPSDVVRVGIYMSTKSLDSCEPSVNLYNLTGYTFDYGSFDDDRKFVRKGTIDSDDITVTMDGTSYTVKDAAGNVVLSGTGDLALHAVSSGKALTEIDSWRRYYGDFMLCQAYNRPGYITLINYVNIEDYVKGVVPYEFFSSWPEETLKAAAVAVRSYAFTGQNGVYSSFGFDLTNTTQVYRGRYNGSYSESYFAATDKAVDATKGLYLTYNSGGTRKICTTFIFSSDGGATEDSVHIFGGDYSYLQGKIDPYENRASSQADNYTYSISRLRTGSTLKQMSSALGLSTIAKDGIEVVKYADTGNVQKVVLTDVNGKTATITGSTSYDRWDFLSGFGFTAYSYRYDVTYNEAADSFTCTRWGWGHNVGMSQWGAYAMAKYFDKDYQDILGFYYDGTSLQYGAY